jgi:hypothetical protein
MPASTLFARTYRPGDVTTAGSSRSSPNSSWRIRAFLGVDSESIDSGRGHQYVNAQKYHMLERVDRRLLDESLHECCGDVMAK